MKKLLVTFALFIGFAQNGFAAQTAQHHNKRLCTCGEFCCAVCVICSCMGLYLQLTIPNSGPNSVCQVKYCTVINGQPCKDLAAEYAKVKAENEMLRGKQEELNANKPTNVLHDPAYMHDHIASAKLRQRNRQPQGWKD